MAITKNFITPPLTSKRAKKQALRLCKDLGLGDLSTKISASKEMGLRIFFSAKAHKDGVPLRAIVTEKRIMARCSFQIPARKIKSPES